uniref:Secreted protein n=1 Tax=Bursaphelenchus xylophilus TaxID=6326 RepID=A0A1I7SEX4_BURXY
MALGSALALDSSWCSSTAPISTPLSRKLLSPLASSHVIDFMCNLPFTSLSPDWPHPSPQKPTAASARLGDDTTPNSQLSLPKRKAAFHINKFDCIQIPSA